MNTNPIREETYDAFKPGLKAWIEQDLKWNREDIISIGMENEILYNVGVDDKGNTLHKYGNHVDITLTNMSREKQHQRFIRLDNGDWQKDDTTPCNGNNILAIS